MKISKTAIVSATFAIFAISAYAQDAQAPAQQPAKAPEAPAVEANKNEDRSYFADYEGKQANVVLFDEKSKKETPVTVKSVESNEVIFVGGGGELSVSKKKTSSMKVVYRPDSQTWVSARNAYNRGNWDESVAYMRQLIYPIIPLMSLPAETFKGHVMLEMYLQALMNADRMVEAESIVSAISLSDCAHELVSSALAVAEMLAQKDKIKEALAIIERVPFTGDKIENIPDMMKVLSVLRKKGMAKECAVYYTKLMNIESPQKNEATLWMVYCDLSLGKKMSAEIYLNQIKLEKTVSEFSLLQLTKGMLESAKDKPDLRVVLDLYAEGIVLGSLASPWMPELLYNTGMAYKKYGKQYAANEIFAQMLAFYPDDVLTQKGQKEIVKAERKKVKKADEDDEDEDDE